MYITWSKNNVYDIRCPCGEKMIYNKDSNKTSSWECPNKECWVISDSKSGVVLIGKPIKL